jgi:hypothetical protein
MKRCLPVLAVIALSLPAFGQVTSSGANLPGVTTDGKSGVAVTGVVKARNLAASVLSFGAKCDGTTDDTTAFEAAWASINTAGGEIDLPAGHCYLPNGVKFNQTTPNSGTTRIIRGLGKWQSYITTHNANIGIELGGVVGITLKDFTLQDNGTTAAVGIARYRTDWTQGYAGQCGSHVYDNISVNGNYSIANLYSIGCEVNVHRDFSAQNGGTGVVLAIAQKNCMGMTGMTMPINANGASDTVNHFYSGELLYYGHSATGAAVYFCNGSADDVTFNGTYFVAKAPAANVQFGRASADVIQGSKSFHTVRFEGSGDAFAINASSVLGLTVDGGSTFGVISPGLDLHQVNTTWAPGASGLTGADIHGNTMSGNGITLGGIFNSNIRVVGEKISILQNSYVNASNLYADGYIFPSNYNVVGSVLTQNDNSKGATGSLKVYYGAPNGNTYGSVVVMQPFTAAPLTPVNGELAMADGVHWQPAGIKSQTLVQYRSALKAWLPVGSTSSTAPTVSGTGATLTNGTNAGGVVALSSASSATITFANGGYNTWAACTGTLSVAASNATLSVSADSKTACTYTFSAAVTGALYYQVNGN